MGDTRQGFKTTDRLRLEIGTPNVNPANGTRNLIRNPSGERGPWGWHVTSTSGRLTSNRSAKDYRAGGTLTFTSVASVDAATVTEFESEAWDVTPGHYAGGQFRLVTTPNSGTSLSVRLVFRDAAGQQIGTGSPMAMASGAVPSVYGLPLAQAPAGTATVHIRFALTRTNTGLRTFAFREVMLATHTSSAEVNSPAFREPLTWTNVLLPTLEVETDRTPLGLGVLAARIRATSLDPATSTLVRPGRPIRLMAYATTGTMGWEPLFWGKIHEGQTSYDHAYHDPEKRALIEITAVDAGQPLANTSAPGSVRQIRDLREGLRNTGVPFELDTSTENYATSPAVLAVNENASLLDQIALTRDTNRSYAAVTRFGVLRAIDRQYMNVDNLTTSPHDPMVATFDPADYNADAVIDFDTKRLVNNVLIQCLYIKEDGTTTDGVFGPYVDAASVREWGAFAETYTIVGVEDDASLDFRAGEILAETATPTRRLSEITFPVTNPTSHFHVSFDTDRRVHLDLLDRVTVNNPAAGISGEHRVAGIKHTITPDKWLVTLSFGSQAGTPVPRTQAAIPAGQSQLLPDTPWVDVTLLNGYTHFDGPSAPVQYRRKDGRVHFRGLLSGGNANGLDAFILPPGFRGAWVRGNCHWQVTRSDVPMLCRTWTTGAVQPTVAGGYIDLAQISYLAEQ